MRQTVFRGTENVDVKFGIYAIAHNLRRMAHAQMSPIRRLRRNSKHKRGAMILSAELQTGGPVTKEAPNYPSRNAKTAFGNGFLTPHTEFRRRCGWPLANVRLSLHCPTGYQAHCYKKYTCICS